MNILSHFISDEIFEALYKMKVFDERVLRNLFISREYKRLRELGYSPEDTLLVLQSSLPTLQLDTIRRIACSIKNNLKKEGFMGVLGYVWDDEQKILYQEKEKDFDPDEDEPEELKEGNLEEEEEEILEPEPEFEE